MRFFCKIEYGLVVEAGSEEEALRKFHEIVKKLVGKDTKYLHDEVIIFCFPDLKSDSTTDKK